MSDMPFFNLFDLLKIENDPELLAFNCPETDIPAWAFIRHAFMRIIIGKAFYENPIVGTGSARTKYAKMISYLIRSSLHNFTTPTKHADVCFLTTGLGNYTEHDYTRDRLASYFAEAGHTQTLIFQGAGNWNWPQNFGSAHTLYNTPSKVFAHAIGWVRTNKDHRNTAAKVIQTAANHARKAVDCDLSDDEINILIRMLAHQLATFPHLVKYYYQWFLSRKVRLLMLEDGCLGSNIIGIIHAARMADVITAEYQHGMITRGHGGYNVGEYLISHPGFRQTMPHYMLTYGTWWNTQFNLPLKKLAVGNPHFAESAKKASDESEKSDILVLGDGFDTQSYLSLAHGITTNAEISVRRVLFRPHPIERDKVQNLDLPSSVEIDTNQDIYQSLQSARFVISELSTGLFEAAAIGCTSLMWSTRKSRFVMPDCPFSSFSSFEELQNILAAGLKSVQDSRVRNTEFFELDWKSNYTKFVEEVLEIDYRNR